MHLLISLRKCN